MFNDLLISSIRDFINKNVKLKAIGYLSLTSIISNLKFSLEEDICEIEGDNDFYFSFNTNQISKIEKNSNSIKIYIDTDLSVLIEKD